MGLDTTHDCWHGPYSSFMRWRERLWQLATRDNDPRAPELLDTYEYGVGPSIEVFLPVDSPLLTLFNHSDCEGEIVAKDCEPLAAALEELLVKLPQRALYDDIRPATERFIKGLRLAASRGEDVEFR